MIEICSAIELAQIPHLYDEMLRLRYRVFHERLRWDVPARDGFDFDQFDVCNPHYILAFNDEDILVGCWRMLDTTSPYMLSDVFSPLLEGAQPPRSPLIWEASRFAVDCGPSDQQVGGLGAAGRFSAELVHSLVEFAIGRGIEDVLSVYDVRMSRVLFRLGAKPYWTSGRHQVGNTIAQASRFRMDQALLSSISEATGITDSVIRPFRGVPIRKAA